MCMYVYIYIYYCCLYLFTLSPSQLAMTKPPFMDDFPSYKTTISSGISPPATFDEFPFTSP